MPMIDMVFTFESMQEAKRFYDVLPKRFAKFGLEMHTEKSSIIPAGHAAAARAHRAKSRLPTFNFLGFTRCRVRFASKLKGVKNFLRKDLITSDTPTVIKSVIRVVRGWVNSHYLSYNRRKVISFIENCKRLLLRWFRTSGSERVRSE